MLDLAAALLLAATAPLAEAIAADDPAALEAELARGADANAVLDYGERPLARAVESQDPALVALLLRHGARPDLPDATGLTPLALACERGNPAIVEALLAAGADPRRPSAEGAWPLALCARFAPTPTVAALLAAGAAPDSADPRGQTPLMWAASAGHAAAADRLLQAGARANRVTPGGFTPLFFAIAGGDRATVERLLAAGADLRHRGPEQTSALQLALYQKAWSVAELLLARTDWDLAAIDRNGNQPLHVAAAAGQPALVSALLARGADPNGLTGPSRITWVTEANFGVPPPPPVPTPPLLAAARAGQDATMRLLVAAGARPDFALPDGTNVVLAAAAGRSAAALSYALSLAPAVDYADARGTTALHRVLGAGDHPGLDAMLRVLAARGAPTDRPNKDGVTPAQLAAGGLATVHEAFLRVFPPAEGSTLAARPR